MASNKVLTGNASPERLGGVKTSAVLTEDFDPELPVIEAIRRGDRYAFAEFVHRQNRFVKGVVLGTLGGSDHIDDVAQQVWASCWRRIGELRDVRRWKSWLYRLARNAAVDAGRSVSRKRGFEKQVEPGPVALRSPATPDGDLLLREQHQMVLCAIEGLPALYREPFVLRHLNDWSYQQIAEVMDMPVDTVETRLVRARRLLREALNEQLDR